MNFEEIPSDRDAPQELRFSLGAGQQDSVQLVETAAVSGPFLTSLGTIGEGAPSGAITILGTVRDTPVSSTLQPFSASLPGSFADAQAKSSRAHSISHHGTMLSSGTASAAEVSTGGASFAQDDVLSTGLLGSSSVKEPGKSVCTFFVRTGAQLV